jgi:acylphosphatase
MRPIRLREASCPLSKQKFSALWARCPSMSRQSNCQGRIPGSLLQFWRFVSDTKLAKRYFVSGMVQGVGFRYFAQEAAEKLRIHGFVRNLRDGRVEVFAIATPQQHAEFCAMLERGPRFSSVRAVQVEPAASDPQYEGGFVIVPSA